MKDKSKRKEWIKTFAIIFLAVLLVLTFFSNTIQNYSLPEVAAQYTNSGTITNRIRGEGTVESTDPYSVVFKQTRKIDSVAVKVGDEVKKGDVLYNLEAGDSQELKEAKEALEDAKSEYEAKIITDEISSSVTSKVESGESGDLESNQAAIAAAKAKIEKAEANKAAAVAEKEKFENGASAVTGIPSKKELEDQKALWEKQDDLNANALDNARDQYGDDADKYDSLKASYEKAKEAYDKAAAALNEYREKHPDSNKKNDTKYKDLYEAKASKKSDMEAAKELYDTSSKALEAIKSAEYSKNISATKISEYEKQISDLEYEYEEKITAAEKAVSEAEEAYKELTQNISDSYALKDLLKKIQTAEANVKKLEETENSTSLVSPVDGTVLSMTYVAGETIEQGETVATIQLAGKGYTISMTITNEQAQLIRVGDEAEVSNSWWYSDVKAKVISIKADRTNPQNGKVVTFQVEGEVTNGQTLSLTVGSRTASYDCIVPSSAIREDNNGKFVYRVISKSTPLGNRYILERVNVTVIASDDTRSAISGDLDGWEYIVTTSSKPLSDGQQVRLKD